MNTKVMRLKSVPALLMSREKFWQKRDDLTGTLCEVKYKEISQDKGTGLESLQFPVFVGLRTDKTEVSYG